MIYCSAVDKSIYLKTIKRKLKKEETLINAGEYKKLKEKSIGKFLSKVIYTFEIEQRSYKLTCYKKHLKGICLLTMKTVSNHHTHPCRTILPFVIRPIEQDERYREYNLVRYPKPKEYQIETHLAYLDAHEAPNLFFWQVPPDIYAYDGIALLLYKNARLIRYYQQSFLKKHFMASLHRMRVLFRRSLSLIEAFARYIEPSLLNDIGPSLRQLHDQTKRLRYLYFIEDLYISSKRSTLFLHTELKSMILEEEIKVVNHLNDAQMIHLIDRLSTPRQFQRKSDYLMLDQVAKEVVFMALGDFKKSLAQTDPEEFSDHSDLLYHRLDSLQTLMEDLHHIIGDRRLEPIKEEINILYKPLREYRNCIERQAILDEIAQGHPMIEVGTLSCSRFEDTKEKLIKAIRLLKTSDLYL